MRYDHLFRESGFHSALLTTFSFDPIGFENVMLTTLKSAGCRNIAVIGDSRMVNQAAVDIGVPSFAGQSYHLTKRRLNGCFHPKIAIQFGKSKGRLLVGSSNLTTSGMIGNLEAFSCIEVSSKTPENAKIFSYLLNYMERHSDSADLGMKRSIEQVLKLTPWLQDVEASNILDTEDGGRLGVFVDTEMASIADQLLEEVGSDHISEMIVVSPFWDADLGGLQSLRDALGNPRTSLIPDLLEQDFSEETAVSKGDVKLCSPIPLGVSEGRRLHAKVVVLKGQDHDYVLTGSMNASRAGLWGRGEYGGNSEAAIFKMTTDRAELDVLEGNLATCLTTPFPKECFQQRQRQGAEIGHVEDSYRDGGQLQIKNGQLRWIAPLNSDDAEAIVLMGDLGTPIYETTASPKHPVNLPDDIFSSACAGSVRFLGGELSAPISIAILSQLERAMEPPHSLRNMRIIEELKSKRDIRDIFEMLGRVEALHHEAMQSKRRTASPGSRTNKKDTTPEPGKILSEKDFYALDKEEDALESLSRTSTLSELRHSINRIVGHYHSRMVDPNEALSDYDTNVASSEEQSTANSHNSNNSGFSDIETPKLKEADTVLLGRSARREALEFLSDILHREEQLRSTIKLQEPGELEMDHGLLFQVIVLTILAVSSSGEPTLRHPLSPLSRDNGGWIRILARFLLPHCEAWKHPKLLNADLDEFQLEALGTLSAAVQILLEALPKYEAPGAVSLPFEKPAMAFLGAGGRMSKTNPTVGNLLESIVRRIMESDDALRVTKTTDRC